MSNLIFVILIVTAWFLTVIGVGWWRRLALSREMLDIPNERSSHTVPTPRGGGAVMFIVIFVFLSGGSWFLGNLLVIKFFLMGAVLIGAISWLDDLYKLPSWLRFGIQSAAALLVIRGIGCFGIIETPFAVLNLENSIIAQLLTLIWIVGLTNAYNFMDGIDGIAGLQGVVAGAGWGIVGAAFGQPLILLFGGLLAAANLGFLRHNWQPARIFMGDVGSAFVGFSLAVIPLLLIKLQGDSGLMPIIAVLFVWVFVFDAAVTFIRRALKRENVFAAHRSHLYQRLVVGGLSHQTVAAAYGLLAFCGFGAAIYLIINRQEPINKGVLWLFGILPAALFAFVTIFESRKKRRLTIN